MLVWSAPCTHDGHDSGHPLVKAQGLILTSVLRVVKLLLDSDSVKHYLKFPWVGSMSTAFQGELAIMIDV